MMIQDVTDTTAIGEHGLHALLVAPLTKDTCTSKPAPAPHTPDDDLMFFMTRSYQTLTYCDGGD